MIWLLAIPVGGALLVALALLLFFVPLRRFPLAFLRRRAWEGRVPYRLARAGSTDFLVVRDLPYPGSFLPGSPTRPSVSLDGTWRFALDPKETGRDAGFWARELDDASWSTVEVPHTLNPARGEATDYLGPVWYRRTVRLPAAFVGSCPRLRFDGLLLRGAVWWNGRLLGEYEGGYTATYFDLTGLVGEENTLVVLCDNRLTADSLPPRLMRRHNPGWHTYGGIHRSVAIEALPPDSVVTVRTREAEDSLECIVLTHHPGGSGAAQEHAVTVAIGREADGRAHGANATLVEHNAREAVRVWRANLPVAGLPRWSPASPERYELTIDLTRDGELVDRVVQTGGLRSVRAEGESILLDGRSVFLKGICKHEDHPDLGATQTPQLIEQDTALIAGMNANYVRLAHYPHAEAEIEALERRGLFIAEEIPLYQAGTGFAAWWEEHGRLRDFPARLFGIRQTRRRELLAHARRQLLELVERDRHRPAVILWGVGNECYSHGRRAGAVFGELADLVRRADPSRLVTYVEITYNIPFFDDARRGWEKADVLSLNSYFGWYFAKAVDLEAHLERLAKRWRGRPLLLSEFGAGAAPGRMSSDGPWRGDRIQVERTYGEDYQVEVLSTFWEIARRTPWVRGVSPWVFSDFYNVWFPANPVPNYNLKGVLSADRKPKLAYHALRELYTEAEIDG